MDGKDKFHEILTRHSPPDAPPPRTESAEAFRNLAGFMGVLFRINERAGLGYIVIALFLASQVYKSLRIPYNSMDEMLFNISSDTFKTPIGH